MSRSLAIVLAATLLVPAPQASAQAPAQPPPPAAPAAKAAPAPAPLKDRIEALRQRIRTGLDAGQIDNEDAARALRELRRLRSDEDLARARNGDRVPEAEQAGLEARFARLEREVRWRTLPAGAAAPAARPMNLWSLQRREFWVEQRVSRALTEGSIDRVEAARVRDELTDIRYQDQRLRAGNGGRLPLHALASLQQRLDRLIESAPWLHETKDRRPW
jgi:hypothetical protein